MKALFRKATDRYGYAFSVICIVAATGLFFLGRDYFAKGQWALLYLLIVGLIAALSGVRPALLASVLAFLAWNYFFLPPFHTFVVSDPKDWLSLIAFLIVSVYMGLQTGRMREREADAVARERETALLNQFSAHLVSDTSVEDMAELLVREIERTAGASSVSLFLQDKRGYLNRLHMPSDASEPDASVLEAVERARAIASSASLAADDNRRPMVFSKKECPDGSRSDLVIPLQTATHLVGVLYIGERGDEKGYSERDVQLLLAVANQAAAFLERKELQALAVQADALREADKLKTTLVSSVSHELKTPLASVTATVSNLLENDIDWNAANVREELAAVQDDLSRLNNSIGALLDLSRLEAASWEPNKEWYEFGEILGTALSRIPQKERGRISFDLPDDLQPIKVDFPQWARVFQNLLENALAYSPEDKQVRVGAVHSKSEVTMWVEDNGPGITLEDKGRIFEKFYRGKAAAEVPSGTGLGLAVTKEIVRSHGGRIWVEDVSPSGARFVVALPRERIS